MPTRHELTVSGERLVAVHHEAPTDDWMFFCHGFQSDKSGSYESRCERAVEEGYNGVRFDFRGCGESSRQFHEQTLSTRLADLAAVIDFFEPPSYVLFGSSFGGKVAFHHDGGGQCHAIVTRAPVTDNRTFDSYRDDVPDGLDSEGMASGTESIVGEFFEDLDQYPFEDVTSGIDVPVAIFHGRDDESVPIEDSIQAVDSLDTDVMLQSYAGEGHLFSRRAEARLRDQCFDWLEATVA